MATYRSLKQLYPWIGPSMIRVKVFRRAEVKDSEGNSAMDFIFVDEEGTKIGSTVNKSNYHHFRIALPEGEWREITNFQISNDNWNNPQFMVADHTYMIIVRHETVVVPTQPLSDNHFFQFCSFERVISGRHDVNYPVDFIEVISYMGKLSPPYRNLEERRSLPFHLRNLRNTELYCIAYEDLAAELYQKWKDNASEPLICVLSEWRVARSNREFIVVDGGGLSRFFFDPNIPEVEEMKQRILNQNN